MRLVPESVTVFGRVYHTTGIKGIPQLDAYAAAGDGGLVDCASGCSARKVCEKALGGRYVVDVELE